MSVRYLKDATNWAWLPMCLSQNVFYKVYSLSPRLVLRILSVVLPYRLNNKIKHKSDKIFASVVHEQNWAFPQMSFQFKSKQRKKQRDFTTAQTFTAIGSCAKREWGTKASEATKNVTSKNNMSAVSTQTVEEKKKKEDIKRTPGSLWGMVAGKTPIGMF